MSDPQPQPLGREDEAEHQDTRLDAVRARLRDGTYHTRGFIHLLAVHMLDRILLPTRQ